MALYQLFRSNFPSNLSNAFIRSESGSVYTYQDMEDVSARFANALRKLGVNVGDRVAVQVEKSPENVFLYLACLRVGAVYLPLNTAYTRGEVEYFIGDATPHVFVCRPESKNDYELSDVIAGVPHLFTLGTKNDGSLSDLATTQPDEFEDALLTDSDLAAILYTSGTTGRSKGAMLTHGNLASNARTLHSYWGFKPNDILIHALPIFHTHGLFVAINTTLLNGSSLILLPKFDPEQALKLMNQATILMGVPTFYTRLLAHHGLTKEAASHMRLFISGSAPLLAETHREFKARTGHSILERYGMTETNMLTSNPLDGERVPGTVGFPLPEVELRVRDEQGQIAVKDEVGVIEVRGPNVFKGYWQMPEKTKQDFTSDGYFITGDVGKIDERGYVHIVGRAKDLIISGGFNVYPKEIESVIDEMEGVIESAVIGVSHPDFGEAVVAVVCAKSKTLSEEQVIAGCKQRLANFKTPKRVFFVDELPRNTMGKVQKSVLRERHASIFK